MTFIRRAMGDDYEAIWSIIGPFLRSGEIDAFEVNWTRAEALAYWCDPEKHTFVAERDGEILGTYFLRAEVLDDGRLESESHYITSDKARGLSVMGAMSAHAQAMSKELGFKGIKFSFVQEGNICAIRIWRRAGFDIVGTVRNAFGNPREGYSDAHVMCKWVP